MNESNNSNQVRRAKDFSELQDWFGHFMKVHHYTPICVCFAVPDDSVSTRARIVDTLNRGLERLTADFPWLAGGAVAHPDTGLPSIEPASPQQANKTYQVLVKDLTGEDESFPSMQDLTSARFPYSLIDGAVVTRIPELPMKWTEVPVPVFEVQANFVRGGGLLLSFIGEHGIMDGVGLGHVLNMFSRACRGERLDEEEVLQGNRARAGVVPLFDRDTYEPGPELEHYLITPGVKPAREWGDEYVPPKATFAYFHFSAASLARLKALAAPAPAPAAPASTSSSSLSVAADMPTPTPMSKAVPYVTTNDAVSAFIWKTVTRIRAGFVDNPDTRRSMFARTYDARPCLSLPSSYLGNMIHQTWSTMPTVSSAATTPLSDLAATLRAALSLSSSDLAHPLRSLATLMTYGPDSERARVRYGVDLDPSTDVWFSSWARLDSYALDFGLGLGLPLAVRKPRLELVEGLMYLMPMHVDGAVEAAICLLDEQMDVLRGDAEWNRFAEWIG